MSQWLFGSLFAVGTMGLAYVMFRRRRKRGVLTLLARRQNPTREEFIALMIGDVSPETAVWMWDTVRLYTEPDLMPHPDDDLIGDLMIDDDDVGMNWLPEFAKVRGTNWKLWPDWPTGQVATVRHFARWLEQGLMAQSQR